MGVRHNCGFCVAHTLHDAYSFIKSLQHRGREAAGIAFIGGESIDVIKWVGAVNRFDIKDLYKLFPSEKYHTYLAHVRYATRGRKDKILQDAHPHVVGGKVIDKGSHLMIFDCDAVIVHNGQIPEEYINEVDKDKLLSDCDSEVILHEYLEKGEEYLLENVPGAYSIAIASKKDRDIVVLRDKSGIKPAALGWKDGKYVVASEDIAFKKNGGVYIEDLKPGHGYYIHPEGHYYRKKLVNKKLKYCFFEYNYISNVDSILNGVSVRRLREELGIELAREFKIDADIVTFLPRCPEPAARRYSEELGIRFENIFYKTRDERSFLGSTNADRKNSISNNLFLLPKIGGVKTRDALKGKKIVIIDDSTIRGNNSRRAIELLKKEVDVGEIYLVNYTPKIGIIGSDSKKRGCVYGVDMPLDDNFVARDKSDGQISDAVGAHVKFLSSEGMFRAFERLGIKKDQLCHFCIGGDKPF